ncbi:MAG: hypothetical protein Q7R33_08185 [Nitrosarchaeum sp.]|nr:hypothetical protein [Nitrosarchaeum sp.]
MKYKSFDILPAFNKMIRQIESKKLKFLLFIKGQKPFKCSGIPIALSRHKSSDDHVNYVIEFSKLRINRMTLRDGQVPVKDIRLLPINFEYINLIKHDPILLDFFGNHIENRRKYQPREVLKFKLMMQ